MKKNFFKKLSFVMALAMIVSVIAPAAGAFAATAPKLSSSKVYLYLDAEGNDYDFNISSKKTGWKYAWTSSNENVAEVAKNGLTTATGVGTSTISVVIKDRDGKKVGSTLKATVIVKDNIKTVEISNAPVNDTVKVGEAFDFNRSYTTVSGATTGTTSITKWTVDKADTASITSTGVFKATVAGEYVVTATTFQSTAKYTLWMKDSVANAKYLLASDTYKVTVAASIDSVKQVDLDTVNVTFTSPMTDVDKNLTVYALVGTTKIKQTVKEVKMDDAKKVAAVTLYVAFNAGATYVVDYTDMTSVQFVAANAKAEDVTAMAVDTTTVIAGIAKDIAVKLFNKDGVDITTTDLLTRVTFASSSEKTYLNNKSLTIFTKGDATTITATFHTYKYDTTNGTEIGNLTASGVVVGTDADATVIGGATAWTIVTGSPVFTDVKHVIAAEDPNYKFFVRLKQTVGTTDSNVDSNGANASKFTYTSSDETVLFIDNTTDTLYPIKQGTVVIVVKYDDKIVDAITVTVGAKRAAAAFTLDAYTAALSNSPTVFDTKVITLTLKDQLGADFALSGAKVEKLSGSPATEIGVLAGNKVTFSGANAVAGTYTYKVTTNGLTQIVTVTVTAPATTTASYYKLQLDATSVDLKVEKDKFIKSVGIQLFGYASNGIKTSTAAVSGAGFVVKVTNPDGGETTVGADGVYALTSVTGSAISGSAIVKSKVGTYKVAVFEGDVVKDVTYFTVTDTQVAPIVASVNTYVSTKTDLLEAVKECFKFTLNGTEITNVVLDKSIGNVNDTNVYVQTVKYQEVMNTDANLFLEHTVTVNTKITKK